MTRTVYEGSIHFTSRTDQQAFRAAVVSYFDAIQSVYPRTKIALHDVPRMGDPMFPTFISMEITSGVSSVIAGLFELGMSRGGMFAVNPRPREKSDCLLSDLMGAFYIKFDLMVPETREFLKNYLETVHYECTPITRYGSKEIVHIAAKVGASHWPLDVIQVLSAIARIYGGDVDGRVPAPVLLAKSSPEEEEEEPGYSTLLLASAMPPENTEGWKIPAGEIKKVHATYIFSNEKGIETFDELLYKHSVSMGNVVAKRVHCFKADLESPLYVAVTATVSTTNQCEWISRVASRCGATTNVGWSELPVRVEPLNRCILMRVRTDDLVPVLLSDYDDYHLHTVVNFGPERGPNNLVERDLMVLAIPTTSDPGLMEATWAYRRRKLLDKLGVSDNLAMRVTTLNPLDILLNPSPPPKLKPKPEQENIVNFFLHSAVRL